jgi:hypothetical protein
LVVIRSKYDYNLSSFIYTSDDSSTANGLSISTPFTWDALSTFTISGGSATPLSAYTNGLNVTLDESQKSYIVNALGTTPINTAGDLGLFVDIITPHYIRQAYSAGTLTDVYGFDLAVYPKI